MTDATGGNPRSNRAGRPLSRPARLGLGLLCAAVALTPALAPAGQAGSVWAGGAGAASPGSAWGGAVGAEEGFWVVSFGRRITPDDHRALAGAGLAVVDYEPADALIVWGSGDAAAAARALASVGGVVPLAPERKIADHLPRGPAVLPVDVVVAGGAREQVETALGGLATARGWYLDRPGGLTAVLRISLAGMHAAELAAHPAVLHVAPASPGLFPEDEATNQIIAGNVDASINRWPVPGYRNWLADAGLDGEGIIVSIADTGMDPDHPAFVDPDLPGANRIVARFEYSVAGSEPGDASGHGTHVAGIAGGNPQGPVFDREDLDGFSLGLGVAPRVRFVDQPVIGTTTRFPPSAGWPPVPDGWARYTSDAWTAGARMWNASWNSGEGARIGYTPSTRAMDVLARDANFGDADSGDFLLVFSAGNAGGSGPTTPHEAKNILSVGATPSGRDLAGRNQRDPIQAVEGFSSRGPARDGRIFPHVVAPGGTVASARSSHGYLTSIPAVCPAPPTGLFLYTMCSGTSMAAPHVVGTAALIHQQWLRDEGVIPSPAMVKAILVNTAEALLPRAASQPQIPNEAEGWGRIRLDRVFSGEPVILLDQHTHLTSPGESETIEVEVADPTRPLQVTLAWSDAPAAYGTGTEDRPALVNDLDLVVERLDGADPVETWLGNVFETGWSIPGGAPDRLNNLENVFLEVPAPGRYRITVRAENLPAMGDPRGPGPVNQDFSLVIRNAIIA